MYQLKHTYLQPSHFTLISKGVIFKCILNIYYPLMEMSMKSLLSVACIRTTQLYQNNTKFVIQCKEKRINRSLVLRWSDTHVNWHLISVMLELSFIKQHKLDVWCIFSQNLSTIFNYFGSDSRDKMDGHHFRVFAAQYHPNFPHIFISGGWDNTVHVSRSRDVSVRFDTPNNWSAL